MIEEEKTLVEERIKEKERFLYSYDRISEADLREEEWNPVTKSLRTGFVSFVAKWTNV